MNRSVQWTHSVTVPNQFQFRSAILKDHLRDWQEISQDPLVLQAVQGVQIPLSSSPPLRCPTESELCRRDSDLVDSSVKELLQLGAIEEIPRGSSVFISKVFTVPKLERGKEYGRRFILNLKVSCNDLSSCLFTRVSLTY